MKVSLINNISGSSAAHAKDLNVKDIFIIKGFPEDVRIMTSDHSEDGICCLRLASFEMDTVYKNTPVYLIKDVSITIKIEGNVT